LESISDETLSRGRRYQDLEEAIPNRENKTMLQFCVTQHDADWIIAIETQVLGRYSDQVRAIAAAIDLANKHGNDGRDAEVITEDDGFIRGTTIWTYGKDAYPISLAKPKNSRVRGTYRMP
jgi:hypothetical protein